jgi:hypothetical protein
MKTDDLINAIAVDGATRAPSLAGRLGVALAIGASIAGAWFVQSLGIRWDIGDALQTWRFVTKMAVVLAGCAAALWATARLARPDADQRTALAVLAVPVAMLALAIGAELSVSPANAWPAWAIGTNSRLCLISIALMSVAPLVSMLVALRAGAPRSPALAGAVAGLLAGCLGATLYAMHCFDDSPLFVALWYTPPIALVGLVGAIAGSRVLRW